MRGSTNKSTFKKDRKTKRNQQRRKENKRTHTHGNDDQRRKENKRKRKQPQPNHRAPHQPPPTQGKTPPGNKRKQPPTSWTSSHFLKQSLRASSKQTQKNASNILFWPREFKRKLGYLQDQCLARWPHMALKVVCPGKPNTSAVRPKAPMVHWIWLA